MLTVTVAVCVVPPPAAVTVMFSLPVAALRLALTVMVEVPPPGAAMDFGLKEMVSPETSPDADNLTAELKLPETLTVMVEVAEFLRVTEREAGEAEMVRPAGDEEAGTVRERVADWVKPPPLAVTVMGYVPAAADVTARVTVDVPEPGGEMDGGLKVARTPAGSPEADNATAELKP